MEMRKKQEIIQLKKKISTNSKEAGGFIPIFFFLSMWVFELVYVHLN